MLMLAYNWCCYAIEVHMMFPWIYYGLWICWMWDHAKDMIMQVYDVYTVCLTHWLWYVKLINEGVKENSHIKLKSLW